MLRTENLVLHSALSPQHSVLFPGRCPFKSQIRTLCTTPTSSPVMANHPLSISGTLRSFVFRISLAERNTKDRIINTSYAVARFTPVFACGSTVRTHFCASFSRSASAKTKHDRKKSTALPKTTITSDTEPRKLCN